MPVLPETYPTAFTALHLSLRRASPGAGSVQQSRKVRQQPLLPRNVVVGGKQQVHVLFGGTGAGFVDQCGSGGGATGEPRTVVQRHGVAG